ncbi:hypothetical protein E8E13_007255 [Curvularia kusanoi]|uniref:Uncharacterized protein n=1 Tax=Curvularia kusanoi TaxID=90978 RepID=A0A9P4TJH2_CURKU|nr:hypothetical protein E8E13_007255 [Curvularia kusanoi]
MQPFPCSNHANQDHFMTITVLFLAKYSGRYPTRDVLRTTVNSFLDNEYRHDLKWLDREGTADMDYLLDMVITTGGVSVAQMPCLSPGYMARVRAVKETTLLKD